MRHKLTAALALLISSALAHDVRADQTEPLKLSWADEFLTIRGPRLPEEGLRVMYLEAFCRPGSTDREWSETVIPHRTELISAAADGRRIELRSTLDDGVVVDHRISASAGEVDFRVTAANPTSQASSVHWAQPCMRVDRFTGRGQQDYIGLGFIFVDGRLARLPTEPWARAARYTPGQVWRPAHVDADDVNPRPVSSITPSNGLIGCFSADGASIVAMAWEPYQELFQGVIVCLHSDFRIGGLEPGEKKTIRGKIYIAPADVPALVERYRRDFPEHAAP